MHVPLHFAERAFALHLFLQGLQRLVDIIVADENLNDDQFSRWVSGSPVPESREYDFASASQARVRGRG